MNVAPATSPRAASATTASRPIEKELLDAANGVRDAAQKMTSSKDASRKVSKFAQQIAVSVSKSVETKQSEKLFNMPVHVLAALTATKDVFVQCAEFMRSTASQSVFGRAMNKSRTHDTVGSFLNTMSALNELLRVRGDACGLVETPLEGLGISAKDCSEDFISVNISKIDVAYDGFRSSLNVMATISDGFFWPLKAIPQTVLYLLQLFEDSHALPAKITQLLVELQQLWQTVAELYDPDVVNERLLMHVTEFFESLQRVVIRLRVAQAIGPLKRFVASHSVDAVLEDEARRLAAARGQLALALQTAAASDLGYLRRMVNTSPTLSFSPSITSDIGISASAPPAPEVFHGRSEFVETAVHYLLQPPSARLAVLGTGGIGKTSVSLVVLHEPRVAARFQSRRYFLSCEALLDADAAVIALAKLLAVEASSDPLTQVLAHLRTAPVTLLVLDNLETTWLVEDAKHRAAFEQLLKSLASCNQVSLIITCRGVVLPPGIRWSNSRGATLEPISSEAAKRAFVEIADMHYSGDEEAALDQLIDAVDAMPLAISLLAQMALCGSLPSELLGRWNLVHSALLQTHKQGREYNVDASIAISLDLLRAASDSAEPLNLLSICSNLPDGLYPSVFEQLRPHFQDIDEARERLRSLALISLGSDKQIKMLSPIRHFVLARHPMGAGHREALSSIYFGIAAACPTYAHEDFDTSAAAVESELSNLTALLLMMVSEPTQEVVDAVFSVSWFAYWRVPMTTLLAALLPHIKNQPNWRADCLRVLGVCHARRADYTRTNECLAEAAELYTQLENKSQAARCNRSAGMSYRLLGQYQEAEEHVEAARVVYEELGDDSGIASCKQELGIIHYDQAHYDPAMENLLAAREAFLTYDWQLESASCTEFIGLIHLEQGDLSSAADCLASARTVFATLGDQVAVAQSTRFLGDVYRKQGQFDLAEQHFTVAQRAHAAHGDKFALGQSAVKFAMLRRDQGRLAESITHFKAAERLYREVQASASINFCLNRIAEIEAELRGPESDTVDQPEELEISTDENSAPLIVVVEEKLDQTVVS